MAKVAAKKTPQSGARKVATRTNENVVPKDVEFRLETGIEFPADDRGREARYPWDRMKHGDSFSIPGAVDKLADIKRSIQQSGRLWLKRMGDARAGWRIIAKIDPKNPTGAIRVWMKDESGPNAAAKK